MESRNETISKLNVVISRNGLQRPFDMQAMIRPGHYYYMLDPLVDRDADSYPLMDTNARMQTERVFIEASPVVVEYFLLKHWKFADYNFIHSADKMVSKLIDVTKVKANGKPVSRVSLVHHQDVLGKPKFKYLWASQYKQMCDEKEFVNTTDEIE